MRSITLRASDSAAPSSVKVNILRLSPLCVRAFERDWGAVRISLSRGRSRLGTSFPRASAAAGAIDSAHGDHAARWRADSEARAQEAVG